MYSTRNNFYFQLLTEPSSQMQDHGRAVSSLRDYCAKEDSPTTPWFLCNFKLSLSELTTGTMAGGKLLFLDEKNEDT